MRSLLRWCKKTEISCTLWIAVCFSLTSAVYLSWLYHLMSLALPQRIDWYSMVIGYSFQAMGMSVVFFLQKRKLLTANGRQFLLLMISFCVVSLPALLGSALAVVLIFGFLMNLLCGAIAGFYLYATAIRLKAASRGTAFGCGYGVSTMLVFLLSLIGHSNFLRTRSVLIVYLLFAAAAAWMSGALFKAPQQETVVREAPPLSGRTIGLGIVTVVLISLVKNLGFNFPTADISSGSGLELSRLFYAVGLILAGIIGDRNRKYGAICTVASLALPFVMLAMSGETVPVIICWGLDYLFYGFFSVFRVVLLMDMAAQSERDYLAPLGLLAGRVGDAAGTGLYLLLASSKLALVLLTLGLFFLTMFLFFRLYQLLYMPEAVQKKSEREVFESFSIQHDLSGREREVLRLVLAEQTIPQMAETLFVSASTVRYHVHNLLQKTGCKSRQELIKQYNMTLYPRIASRNQNKADDHCNQ